MKGAILVSDPVGCACVTNDPVEEVPSNALVGEAGEPAEWSCVIDGPSEEVAPCVPMHKVSVDVIPEALEVPANELKKWACVTNDPCEPAECACATVDPLVTNALSEEGCAPAGQYRSTCGAAAPAGQYR